MTTTHIVLLRHGLPEGDNCFRGHTDFKLTELGLQQMYDAMANGYTADKRLDVVVSSPLSRCSQFAVDYATRQQCPVMIRPDFIEINFGEWDGQPKQKIWDDQQQELTQFWAEPWRYTPPKGESLIDYDIRIQRAWDELLTEFIGKNVLLVTHGGVIKQLLRQLLDMPQNSGYLERLDIPYAGRITISVYHDQDGKLWPRLHWPTQL
jgi:broad specificity phosphatase PhoE